MCGFGVGVLWFCGFWDLFTFGGVQAFVGFFF